MGQRLTTMTCGQSFPIAPSKFKFAQHGQSGAWVSELLPDVQDRRRHRDGRSVWTEAINHDPAVTYITPATSIRAGRAWARG